MDPIKLTYESHKELYDFLLREGQVTYATDHSAQATKALLLSCASQFEVKILAIIKDIMCVNECLLRNEFIYYQALNRKYHSLFKWEDNNANAFFALFGSDFKDFMKKKVREDLELKNSIQSFLKIGELRNILVHNDFLNYSFSLTEEEVYSHYNNAIKFVDSLSRYFYEFKEETHEVGDN